CGTLHRCVDRCALRRLATRRIAAVDLRQIEPPPEQRLHVTARRRLLARPVHELPHPWITGEVALDVGLGLAAADLQLARQAEGRHAVDQTEVDRLGAAPLISADRL